MGGSEMFRGASNFQFRLAVTNGMSFWQSLADSPADGSQAPPQKASGDAGLEDYSPQRIQKSLEILATCSIVLIFCLLIRIVAGRYFCFY